MAQVFIAKGRGGVWSTYAKDMRNYACLRYAVEFHNVARKAGFPIIRAFLLGQALELYLKAFLFSHGYRETALKKTFGHNLKRLLDEAIAKDLDAKVHIALAIRTDIEALSSVYASKALQYFSILYLLNPPTIPNLRRLLRFATALKTFLVKYIHKPT